MKRCLLWGAGKAFNKQVNLVKYYELSSKIKVLGITAKEGLLDSYCGYNFIDQNDIEVSHFDIVIIMSERITYNSIYKDIINKGFKDEQIVFCELLGYSWFDFNKYIKLKKSDLTIFANNCWGGLTYNLLNLQFKSPFINMHILEKDYLKIIERPKHYISQELIFGYEGYDSVLKRKYPVCFCDDVELHCNHYENFDFARACWERRKKRINWDNILVMLLTESERTINEFIQLPYDKKICFTSKQISTPSVCEIKFKNKIPETPLWKIVNIFARQNLCYYNVLDLLLEGKINYD